jgi:hypothetical protein
LDHDGTARKEREKMTLPARVLTIIGDEACGSGVNAGVIPMVPRGDEVDDGVQNLESNSRAWSTRTAASWSEEVERLELHRRR